LTASNIRQAALTWMLIEYFVFHQIQYLTLQRNWYSAGSSYEVGHRESSTWFNNGSDL